MMNKHNDRTFKCDRCDFSGAFQWQLTHHQKNCGFEYACLTCGVKYNKTALLMHCRRKNHECIFSDTKKKATTNAEDKPPPVVSCIVDGHLYTPVVSLPSKTSPLLVTSHRPILPKLPNQTYEKRSTSTETDHKLLRKSASKSKRSAEVQTVKKYYRSNRKKDSKSAETQTLDSSFKVPQTTTSSTSAEPSYSVPESLAIGNSKSCFTQTFDFESDSSMSSEATSLSSIALVDDPYWDGMPAKLNTTSNSEQSVQTDALDIESLFPLSGNGITTAQTQTSITDCDQFSTLFPATSNDNPDGLTFHDYDLEFLDIETQTNWNFDQTTQTEHNSFGQLFDS